MNNNKEKKREYMKMYYQQQEANKYFKLKYYMKLYKEDPDFMEMINRYNTNKEKYINALKYHYDKKIEKVMNE
jgi:hypothetical protein